MYLGPLLWLGYRCADAKVSIAQRESVSLQFCFKTHLPASAKPLNSLSKQLIS